MDWLNLHISKTHSPEFRLADERTRGVWISLLAYCISQENSGIIDNCEAWASREWQQLCGVSKKLVDTDSALWSWLDGSVVVKFYPIEKQNEVQLLRARAKTAADARWHSSNANGHASGMPSGNAEGKGREGEGKEGDKHCPSPPGQKRFGAFLKRMRMAHDDEAIGEWAALARELDVTGYERLSAMIEYVVDLHRQNGGEARYVRHVEQGCRNWAKMKRDTERTTRESA